MWAMLGFFARKDHANTEFKVEFNSLVSDTWSSLSRRFGIYLILCVTVLGEFGEYAVLKSVD